MGYLLFDLKTHFNDLNSVYFPLVQDLVEMENLRKYKVAKKVETIPKEPVHADGCLVIEGPGTVLSGEQIEQFMDTGKNVPLSKGKRVSKIKRVLYPKPFPVDEVIRRICCIDREYEFQVLNEYNLINMVAADHEDFTVFRTEVNGKNRNELRNIMKKGLKIKKYQKLELVQPKVGYQAHGPLKLTNLRMSDIHGKDGLLLVSEYDRPWRLTFDKADKQKKKKKNVKSFKSNGHSFERVERYEFGKAHNYESLLIAMFEKYGFPFEKTAKMAEELYINID